VPGPGRRRAAPGRAATPVRRTASRASRSRAACGTHGGTCLLGACERVAGVECWRRPRACVECSGQLNSLGRLSRWQEFRAACEVQACPCFPSGPEQHLADSCRELDASLENGYLRPASVGQKLRFGGDLNGNGSCMGKRVSPSSLGGSVWWLSWAWLGGGADLSGMGACVLVPRAVGILQAGKSARLFGAPLS